MSEEIIHTYRGSDCSRGHRYIIKFRSTNNGLSWAKVCKRCGKSEVITGSFDSQGAWKRNGTTQINVDNADSHVQSDVKEP
jgi:hypothetical protein